MSQASGTGLGDDLQATMEAILQCLDKLDTIEERISALEAKLLELQPLQDQVTLLEETVIEQGKQQRTLHAAINRVEREQGCQHKELNAAIERVIVTQRNLGWANQAHRQAGDDGADVGNGAFLPTTPKLEFSKFDDTSDPLLWLNHCERYFLVRRTPEHQRVAFAAFYLLDDAQL
jgi:small-conductance mechanosensitive channel